MTYNMCSPQGQAQKQVNVQPGVATWVGLKKPSTGLGSLRAQGVCIGEADCAPWGLRLVAFR